MNGSKVYIGGEFDTVGWLPRSNAAALDATTGNPTDWNPNANINVLQLVPNENVVYARGNFHYIGGQKREEIAALDATTGLATA